MRKLTTLAAAVLLTTAACAPAGYYDSNGVYRSYGKSDSFNHNHAMAGTPETPANPYYDSYAPASAPVNVVTYHFNRAGYYDYYGHYVPASHAPQVAEDYFPPQGMCRVWFRDRTPEEQPPVEACDGIRARVPNGAYVIYGG